MLRCASNRIHPSQTRRMAHYRRLVAQCVEALATFDPSSTSVEDHLQRVLEISEKKVALCPGGLVTGWSLCR